MDRNNKLGDISWNDKNQLLVLEKAVSTTKNKNGFLAETFEKLGPPNKDSVLQYEMAKL